MACGQSDGSRDQPGQAAPFRQSQPSPTARLGWRCLADADVPDLELLPDRLPGRPSVRFRAGTDRAIQVVGLSLVARLVKWGVIADGRRLARLLRPLQRMTGLFSSPLSGMEVRVVGEIEGRAVERIWTLTVPGGRGPEVPTLAAALLVERMLNGSLATGAYDARQALSLDEFSESFREIGAITDISEREMPPPLYRRVMGKAFDTLPETLRAMHSMIGVGGAQGRGTVERGSNPLARLIAAVMRFPRAGEHDLHVLFEIDDSGETWTRDFGGQRFYSRLSMARGRLTERFGPLRFSFDLPGDTQGLAMILHGWRAFGVPVPLWLAPRIAAREWQEDGHFRFDVAIAMPLVGPVVRYRGWLDRIA